MDDEIVRRMIPWEPRAFLRAMQKVGDSPGKVSKQLKREYGEEVGQAHLVRLMAASAFLEENREALLATGLCIMDDEGFFMTGGLVEALATLPFSVADKGYDRVEVMSRAHRTNRS